MANPEHLKILEQGVEVWNKWRAEDFHRGADLSNANLRGADLINVLFVNTNLIETDLSIANLNKANFNNALLYHANLKAANLNEAIFYNVNFDGVDLSWTFLKGVNFTGSTFSDANFFRASLGLTYFVNCNLSGAKNVDSCYHDSWCIIDHRTLAKSLNLSLQFLRRCDLPDEIIDIIPVLQNNPIIFYSCFISYSSKDTEFANRLHADLQNKGIPCWYAPEKMKGGKKIYDQVNEAIRMHDKLLLVLSEDSMNSEWVATEIKKARAREKQEKRQMLFPIAIVPYDYIKQWELFDADTGSDLAAEVRSYHIPDFSEWKKHDSYKKGLERLVKDLRGEKKIV